MEKIKIGRGWVPGRHCSLEDCNLDRIDSRGAEIMKTAVKYGGATHICAKSSDAEVQSR